MRRDTINVVLCGLLAQAAGFLKLLLVARYFGVGPELDGYYLALVLPALIQGFLIGALQTGFVPVYAALRHEGRPDAAAALSQAVSWRLLAVLLCSGAALSAASHPIMAAVAGGAGPAAQAAAASAFQVLAFSAMGNGLIDYFSLVLNARGRYLVAALGPGFNALVSGTILLLWPEWGISNLVWGLMAGLAGQLLLTVWACRREGIALFGFPARRAGPSLKKMYLLMLPILAAVLLSNASVTVTQLMSAYAGEGAVSTIGYATRLHGVLVQVFVIGTSAVLLPGFASVIAAGDRPQLLAMLRATFRASVLVATVSALVIGSAGSDLVSVMFQRGQFDDQARHAVWQVWCVYTLALMPTCWGVFIAKYFQAAQRPWVISRLAALSFGTTAIAGVALLGPAGVIALPIAGGLAYLAVAVGFQRALVAHLGQPVLRGEWSRAAAALCFAAAAGSMVHAVVSAMPAAPPLTRVAAALVLAVPVALALAQVLRVVDLRVALPNKKIT